MSFTGSCLCQKVRYSVARFASTPVHCHCETCRKRQGAVMSTNAPVADVDFKLLEGEALLSKFESSPGKFGYFCSHCGSHLFARKEGVDYHIVRLACVDNGALPLPKPSEHIWRSDAASWFDLNQILPEKETGRFAK